eukprot:763813-Hanusia_phi.AAC.1
MCSGKLTISPAARRNLTRRALRVTPADPRTPAGRYYHASDGTAHPAVTGPGSTPDAVVRRSGRGGGRPHRGTILLVAAGRP